MDGALGRDFRPRMAPLLGRYAADEEFVLRMLAAGPAVTVLESAGCFFHPTTRCITRLAAFLFHGTSVRGPASTMRAIIQ